MANRNRFRSIARLVLATFLATASIGGMAASPDATASALSRWTGGVDLYRSGVFTTQKTWLWCTAADLQIIRNIVDRQADHSRSGQQRYFDYMRAHNRYRIPVSDGVDPAGWTAGLRQFVDSRYRLYANRSFDSALRSAVTNLRKTNLPVGLTVAHGTHAWVLTGFTATADPATATRFTVTSVRVVGPLWGLQSRTYGYDMRPDRKLTPSQLKGFFTPWHYAGVKMAWEGRWVSVQPVAALTAAPTIAKVATPTARPTAAPAAAAQASAAPTSTPEPAPTMEPTMADVAALVEPAASVRRDRAVSLSDGLVVLVVAALALLGGLALRARGRPHRKSRRP